MMYGNKKKKNKVMEPCILSLSNETNVGFADAKLYNGGSSGA